MDGKNREPILLVQINHAGGLPPTGHHDTVFHFVTSQNTTLCSGWQPLLMALSLLAGWALINRRGTGTPTKLAASQMWQTKTGRPKSRAQETTATKMRPYAEFHGRLGREFYAK